MRGFKMSKIHLPPIKKVAVKKTHYRLCLILSSGCIVIAHIYIPEQEHYVAFATNLLFAIDPTT